MIGFPVVGELPVSGIDYLGRIVTEAVLGVERSLIAGFYRDDDRVSLQDIFIFDQTGVTEAGKVQGRFRSTGVTPKILDRLRVAGISLPSTVFDEVLEVNM